MPSSHSSPSFHHSYSLSLQLTLLEAIFFRNLDLSILPHFSLPISSSSSPLPSPTLHLLPSRLPSLRSNLFDSYLSLSIPTIIPPILNSHYQLASSNPSFTIDLHNALNSRRLHPAIKANKLFIRTSHIFQITLFIRNTYPIIPPTTSPSTLVPLNSTPHGHDHDHDYDDGGQIDGDHLSFRPALQWTVDLRQLVCLGKADSDSILLPLSSSTSTDPSNQLYLKLRDEIYLFRPTPPSPPPPPLLHSSSSELDDSIKTKIEKMFRISDAIKLIEKEVELRNLMTEISCLENSLDQSSNSHSSRNSTGFHLSRRLHEIDHHINHLTNHQTLIGNRLSELKEELRQRVEVIGRRRTTVEGARARLRELVDTRISAGRQRLREVLVPEQRACRAALERRRAELVRALDMVFPIAPVVGADAPLLFSIAGVPLKSPESVTMMGSGGDQEERVVASALGLVAQVTTLVGMYLAVPVLYPISCVGSRSVVSDYVSRIKGPRSFPLYFKGVDRYRFEYGVFLLNKDIEQIMYHRQVTVSDLRHTLPNLKNLMLTVETSSSFSICGRRSSCCDSGYDEGGKTWGGSLSGCKNIITRDHNSQVGYKKMNVEQGSECTVLTGPAAGEGRGGGQGGGGGGEGGVLGLGEVIVVKKKGEGVEEEMSGSRSRSGSGGRKEQRMTGPVIEVTRCGSEE